MVTRDPEKQRAYQRAYYKQNREKLRASRRAYYEKNREKLRAANRAYYEKNREERLASQRDYREQNREELLAYQRAYNARRSAERAEVINEYLSMHPCRACGERDSEVLQFHHLQPGTSDSGGVTNPLKSWPWMWREIAKCIVLCANCHVRFHKLAAQMGVRY